MKELRSNIRFYVLIVSFLLSLNVYFLVQLTVPSSTIQIIRLTQIYALLSVLYLYLTLLAGPLCFTFRALPFRGKYLKSRRALGVSAFYFALLHALLAFFGQLGGFAGLGFLSNTYLVAISISFASLLVLSALAFTSFDKVIAKLTFPRWKMLHRLVYAASIGILVHAVMLGTHFQDLSAVIPQLLIAALGFLLFLELLRIDNLLHKKFPDASSISLISLPLFGLLFYFSFSLLLPRTQTSETTSFGIHAEHIRLAKLAQQGVSPTTSTSTTDITSTLPGMTGDRTKRYTVSFHPSENPQAGKDIQLRFQVFDASNGNPVTLFNKTYGEIVHLIIVDSELEYFSHIHPTHQDSEFSTTTTLPHEGRYHIYLDFQPFGAIEQQLAFTLDVGTEVTPAIPKTQSMDRTQTFGSYEVTLDTPSPLQADKMSIGEQPFTFTIKDDKTGKPITTLKPYLQAFGHLVMIHQKTYDYIHVHPAALRVPKPDENGGPTVEFLPLGLYGPIKPGIYRVFAQFNPNNNLFTSDLTIEVK